MLVSYKWLREYLDLTDVTPEVLADKLSRTGIEVESVVIPAAGLKKIVVGAVEECVPHPDSDHLSICQVNVGEEELSQIVCGAPNIQAGKKVIVALPGSRIAGNVKIKKGKLRGEVSLGMICSLQELGYAENVIPKEYADGIYFLEDDAVPGSPVFPYLDMDDTVIELAITPNRADALSMRGVAYEVGAIYQQTPHFEERILKENPAEKAADYLSVKVTDTKAAPTYSMRMIKNVKIAESPTWLKNRLMNAGIRPINNVVDVTNFVLLEFGQPLHAFDYDQLGSKEIEVRLAKDGETLTTLDGEERKLSADNLIITNGQKPLALAGVMGGEETEITDKTVNVALEAALFDRTLVRQTAKMFNLRSEASSRFEKGINPATVLEALNFAAAMIAELSTGEVLAGTLIGSEQTAKEINIQSSTERINAYLGTDLTTAEIVKLIEALGFGVKVKDTELTVTVPPRRWDLEIEADLFEEVARLYGYDNLPSTLPKGKSLAGALTPEQKLERHTKTLLAESGLTEAISYVLTTEEKATRFPLKKAETVKIQWPMSEERSVLRQNLISGLLDNVAYNVARQNKNLALFEIGRVFYQEGEDLPDEVKHLVFALTGLWQTKDWQDEKVAVDFYLAKGFVEELFASYGLAAQLQFEATDKWAELHPGRTAAIVLNDVEVGFIGQVHPTLAKELGINETYVCELDLEQIFANPEISKVHYQAVSKFPAVTRDIALLVKTEISHQALVKTIREHGGHFLQNIELFDVYQGENVPTGSKSMAYTLTFLNPEATLTDEEITKAMAGISQALTAEYQAEIR